MSDEENDNDSQLFPNLGSTTTDPRSQIHVRFVNKCSYPVDVFWMSFKKKPIKYGIMIPKQYLDIQTYKNHPWVARRSFDGLKLKMNGKVVFWPESGTHNVCIYCFITPKILSLKEMVSRLLIIKNPSIVPEELVSLPRDLQIEVRGFLDKKTEYFEIVHRSVSSPPAPPAAQ